MNGVPAGAVSNPFNDGILLASQSIPFACGGATGTIENLVVRNASNEIVIYYQVRNDPTSVNRVISLMGASYAGSPIVDADYRTDLPGVTIPTDAARDPIGARLTFSFWPGAVSPGVQSRWMYGQSQRMNFDANGVGSITVGGTTCGVVGLYQSF